MYPYYKKWIHSHRDLPLKINQWTNIVRWEFKDPTPFIRTREFLWQEGHTAHATAAEADKMVTDMLEVYRKCYEEILAIPVIKGVKSEEEKFPGADYTTSVETILPSNGRGVQAATSHQLGQNFSKMFEIYFENEKCEKDLVWQTSWGFTTRSIGIMVLMHGDDKGIILPPRVAPVQVVMVPIFYSPEEKDKVMAKLNEIEAELKSVGIRTKIDDRMLYTPGFKFNHWELKGVPIRLELGIKDYDKAEVRAVTRIEGKKTQMKWATLKADIPLLLDELHKTLLQRAKDGVNKNIAKIGTWTEFMTNINQRKACLTPWYHCHILFNQNRCKTNECEVQVKVKSSVESKKEAEADSSILTGSVKTLCIPYESEPIQPGEKCFACGKPALARALWGRSY
jgi:prolyl-tRNA synthetase